MNPLSAIAKGIDYVDIEPERMVRMVLRHRDLQSVLPFNGWWQNPITAVFTVRGCVHECVTCGGSASACSLLNGHRKPAFRSPKNLVKNISDVCRLSRGPIFLVGDLFQAGEDYLQEALARLAAARINNEIVFEVFGMPSFDYLKAIDRSVQNWSLELSPESHDEAVRRRQDGEVFYTNDEMEAVIREALGLRCHRLDVFFMIGLSAQTCSSVMQSIDYCEKLFRRFDRRLSCFISPMGPFLDPGSHIYENPEKYGFHLFAETLEDHRRLLLKPTWGEILNYETDWMSRDEMVDVTYDAAEALNALKLKYGRIDKRTGDGVALRIRQARELKARLADSRDGVDEEVMEKLRGDIHAFSVSTVCDKQELFWRRHVMNFRWPEILRIGAASLYDKVRTECRQLDPGKLSS